jgi:hypothetical protein
VVVAVVVRLVVVMMVVVVVTIALVVAAVITEVVVVVVVTTAAVIVVTRHFLFTLLPKTSDWNQLKVKQKIPEQRSGKHEIRELQQTAMFGAAHKWGKC